MGKIGQLTESYCFWQKNSTMEAETGTANDFEKNKDNCQSILQKMYDSA